MPCVVKQRPPEIDSAPTLANLAAKIVQLHERDPEDLRVGSAIIRLHLEGKMLQEYTSKERQALWDACGWGEIQRPGPVPWLVGVGNARRPLIIGTENVTR